LKDRFSDQALQYATFRPRYPKELYDFIFSHVKKFDQAWDAGTGNGQAAVVLAERFKSVLATDISQKQLDQAEQRANITYAVSGETCKLPDRSVDLITVAQAIHWFDRPKFYKEVNRVAVPGAILGVWVYGLLKVSSSIDPLLDHFYTKVVGPYWDPERRLIDEQLKSIDFPFDEISATALTMNFSWTLAELEGYLNTWSATQKFIADRSKNPVPELIESIRKVCPDESISVDFPVYLRMSRA